MPSLSELSQYIFSGLSIGCIYALVGLGFVLIANVTNVYNFAQGEYVMVGGMIVAVAQTHGWSNAVSVPLAVVVVAAVAGVQDRITVAPVQGKVAPLMIVVGTLGTSMILRGIALYIWDKDPRRASPFVAGTFSFLGAHLSRQSVLVWATTAASLVAVVLLFRVSRVGRAMRACSINPTAVRLLGIRSARLGFAAFLLSGALSGLVGAVTVPLTLVRWDSGIQVGLVAFIAAALAGFTSPTRTVLAGLTLGIIESLSAGVISSQYRMVFVYGVLVVFLFLRDLVGDDGVIRRALRRRQSIALDVDAPADAPRLVGAAPLVVLTDGALAVRPSRRDSKKWKPVICVGAAALVPLLVHSPRGRDAAVFAVLSAIAATGLGLVLGLARQISLGQAGFMLIGGYSAAILVVKYGWNAAPAAAVAIGLAVALAAAIGWLSLRLRGFNLAIVTLAIHLVFVVCVTQMTGLTGGALGTTGIPPLRIFGVAMFSSFRFYYVGLLALSACLVIARNINRSAIGRGLRALGADEDGAESLAVRAFRLKLVIFVVSAAMAGLAGVLWAYFVRFAAPTTWGVSLTISLVTYVIVGGLASIYGGAAGAAAVSALLYWVRTSGIGGTRQDELQLILSGVLLVLFVLFLRQGLVEELKLDRIRRLLRGRAADGVSTLARPVTPPPDLAQAAGRCDRRSVDPLGAVLTVRSLSKRFGAFTAVNNVSFHLYPGTVTAMVGPNGAGKSTVVNLIASVLLPTGGDVLIDGQPMHGLHANEVARLGVARTFQTPKSFGAMTTVETVMLARDRFSSIGLVSASLALPRGRKEELLAAAVARRYLEFVGLGDSAELPTASLPVGHQRLADVARALAIEPRVILLDEPAAGLDHRETAELGTLVRSMATAGIAVLLVEHDMAMVMSVADRVVVLDQGAKMVEGTPDEISVNQDVIDAYLGVVHV